MTIPETSAAEALPITDSQRGLLVIDSWIPTRQIYNQVMRFDIDPRLTAEEVARGLRSLVAVQPALRQVFRSRPDFHAVLAAPPAELPCEQVVADNFEAAADELADRLGRLPFDLETGPAYRFGQVRAADGSAAAIVFCGHHAVGDGVSLGPIIRDLNAALTGRLAPAEVPELRRARETALRREMAAQNRAGHSEQAAGRARSWAKQLADVPPLVLAPRPERPAETDFSGARKSWLLTEAETAGLHRMCKRLSVSPFVLLTAVYGAVLARHGGVDTVLVGSPFATRRTVGSFDLCGFFVNTLPVTVEVAWERTVDDHVGQVVRDAVDHCRSNVDISFNRLVAELRQDRPGNRNPLFSCMIAMQDTYRNNDTGPVRGVSEPGNGTAKFDLWLGATPVGDRWLLEIEHDLALIGPAVADGLLDSLRTALRRAVADGSRPLAELFTDATAAAPAEPAATAPADSLADWLAEAARRTPDAPAVDEPGRQLTHAELDAAAQRVAAGLTQHGTGHRDIVAIATETLADTVTAILAILRCGATFLPLDLSLPPQRLAQMLATAGCRIVIGSGVDAPGVRTVGLAELALADGDPRGAAPDSAAYLMFTSGSTGTPKGVLMGQHPLLNLTAWQIEALDHRPGTRFLQYAPLGFDVSFQEIVPTLAAGGTVVSRQPVDRRDFPALARHIADTGVTHAFLPVAALKPFVQAARGSGIRFPALSRLCVSGEQLFVDAEIRRFLAEDNDCELINLYGPTETNAATAFRLTGRDPDWPGHVPIGRPLPGVATHLVDDTGHLAPVGVPGELYLGGVAPADGYLGDPARTAAGFLPDRFAAERAPDARMYRTGDQAVRDEHGTLIFLGRRDTQLKVRGYRVELGEIESVAERAESVAAAVAAPRGTGADRELVLFLHARPGRTPDHAEVRGLLAGALPAYMVPSRIFDIESVPTTRTGKTDRAALVELAGSLAERAEPGQEVVYADDLERELAGLWSEILEVEGIQPGRSLLEYGAHSLNAFTAFAQIEDRYGITVAVADFFRSPTVTALAGLIRDDSGEALR